ncbi:hypothetical protein FHU41_002112 [Psychromicrobium silvestre]|uniref:Uncharacterized protein n=1 Tax=Psychromicrobium silvestre TaxID=1645614 RepID=A0A7Y9LUJ2_9MICC|nr:hypothetical protein [Psychromicrobium silvestre]NYE95862.1 hypothetical protein [Psychromicrobium silvestre]
MFTLGIEIDEALLAHQVSWFAPARQPFLVSMDQAEAIGVEQLAGELPAEVRDTFEIYQVPVGFVCILLGEEEFNGLSRTTRSKLIRGQIHLERGLTPTVRSSPHDIRSEATQQGDGHRFVWWQSLLKGHEEPVLDAYLRDGRRPSRHSEVPERLWEAAQAVLPQARSLAGTFPLLSGPNCFATVMAAAGVPGAAEVWMLQQPFEDWLQEFTVPGGADEVPGTVLVWRSPEGLVQHAAITIGGGYALHKPSQGWMSPRKVLTVPEVIASSRQPGRRLARYRLSTR